MILARHFPALMLMLLLPTAGGLGGCAFLKDESPEIANLVYPVLTHGLRLKKRLADQDDVPDFATAQNELQGLLLLGPKRSDSAYTAEDLELLETLKFWRKRLALASTPTPFARAIANGLERAASSRNPPFTIRSARRSSKQILITRCALVALAIPYFR